MKAARPEVNVASGSDVVAHVGLRRHSTSSVLQRRAHLLVATSMMLPWVALADLPVHCLRHQVVGDWEFTLGAPQPHRSSCGHQKPDSPNGEPALDFLQSQGPTTTKKIFLEDPSRAATDDGTSGSWTMIYDEAFEVTLGDMVFLAFSNFEFVEDPVKGKTNVSHCDRTQIGWYHNIGRTQWGCYVGRKASGSAQLSDGATQSVEATDKDSVTDASPAAPIADKTQSVSLASLEIQDPDPTLDTDDVQPASSQLEGVRPQVDATADVEPAAELDTSAIDAYIKAKSYKQLVPSAGYDSPMNETWQQSVVDTLNFLQLGWTAAVHHIFQNKTVRELNRLAGVKHSRPVPKGGFRASQATTSAFHSFLGVRSRVKRTSGHGSFDWRHKDEQDWLQPVVTQGDCGSCYTISTVHMLTARNRITKNDASKAPFSVKFPLYCSEYNQGCDGGYGFLQSKWSEDVGLVPEKCASFDEFVSCHALADCDMGSTRFRATNHRYVGGYYGASEESLIREELVKNGPAVMSFEPKEDFMYYKNGVYKSGPNKIHQEWEQVDHAVLLVGYGEEQNQAYWTLQNSWGTEWGEAGFFRMARGIDESGCESIVVAADVVEEDANDVLDNFLSSL